MEQELIKKAQELFNSSERWNSFLDLTSLKEKIINAWFSKLNDEIIKSIELEDIWGFYRDNNNMVWHLKEFGRNSLSIWLEGEYFSLWANRISFNTDLINEELKGPKYKSIYEAIPYKDSGYSGEYFFREKGRFEFNNSDTNNFESGRIAWFAGNETEYFVKQIKSKLQPFFKKESTDLLIELNRLSKKQ